MSSVGPSGPGSADLLPGAHGHHPQFQPLRAALVVVLAVVVGVFVLARTGSAPTTVATHATTTSARTTVPLTKVTRPSGGVVTTSTATTVAPTTTLAPSKVTVLVLNGWTVRHAALFFQHKLAGAGYDTLAPTNATGEGSKTSQVLVVSPVDDANALAIASLLGLASSAVMTPTAANDTAVPPNLLHQADLVLVVGGDISNQVPAGYNG